VTAPPDSVLPAADPLLAELRQELGAGVLVAAGIGGGGGVTLEVPCDEMAQAAAILRTRFRYSLLADLSAADHPERDPRFEVIYHLYSFRENRRIRVRLRADGRSPVPSVVAVWRGADWLEREVHELFGIAFAGRSPLRPLLLWQGFVGYPLRKDFPLAGLTTGAGAHPDLPPRPRPLSPRVLAPAPGADPS
jgi:NADH-quinone oxidoreductase subunit C